MTPAVMFQGTGSGVGKSVLTAGICRVLARRGVKVAPFKAQNMALNSGVTPDGREIGRAQMFQAECAGLLPDVRMNPILLKPEGHGRSQLIRMGRSAGSYSARDYYTLSEENFRIVQEAYTSLAAEYECIVIEGAGSPAEINLQATDIVNMRMARFADARVFIVADIDRGGVFAWMKGTYDLVPQWSRGLIEGFIINRFRGDVSLLTPGIRQFEEIVPCPVVGVVPWCDLAVDEEDSQNITNGGDPNPRIRIGVVRLPRMSNFTDFTPLKALPGVYLEFVTRPEDLERQDIIIIPGTKNTIGDMRYLRESGFAAAVLAAAGKKPVVGICGGYQMLGEMIFDPERIEGEGEQEAGLGLFPVSTTMEREKTLVQKEYTGTALFDGVTVAGYEIHIGTTTVHTALTPCVQDQNLCQFDAERKILGTYIHGLFDRTEVTERVLRLACPDISLPAVNLRKQQIDALADHLEASLDIGRVLPFLT